MPRLVPADRASLGCGIEGNPLKVTLQDGGAPDHRVTRCLVSRPERELEPGAAGTLPGYRAIIQCDDEAAKPLVTVPRRLKRLVFAHDATRPQWSESHM